MRRAALARAALRQRVVPRVARRRLSQQAANESGPSFSQIWAPRLIGVAVPVATGIALYKWRHRDEGGSFVEPSEVPRSQFDARYTLKRSLGKGGFGEVWLAVDKATGKEVAVKVLSLRQLPRSLVEQEITAMRRCGRHPSVVALLDVCWIKPDGANPYGEAALVMELAAGGGLFERLVDEGAYSEEYAAKILRQIAIALYHLHSRGIVHRDIKPENVVFELAAHGSTAVKLIDFGTAVALEGSGEKVSGGGRIGTWSYWAPEQLNKQSYDFAVDMWSLGVLLYILLVGFHPFDPEGEGDEQAILRHMKAGRISFDDDEWRRVSPQAKSLVTQLLQHDPKQRLTAAELVTHPWVRGEDVPVAPLPATHERLSAFIKARHAFYGSLLMGILAHHLTAAAGAEGVGAKGDREFNAFEVGWKLFDADDKGHIDASDLRRVCKEMGYTVSQRDIENMLAVMSPTQLGSSAKSGDMGLFAAKGKATKEKSPRARDDSADGDGDGGDEGGRTRISFERYQNTMQASFLRRFNKGVDVFKRGDPVDHFYVITRGQCDVMVPNTAAGRQQALAEVTARRPSLVGDVPVKVPDSSPDADDAKERADELARRNSGEIVIATLGPGDFFGETGLLEGRETRAASVRCRTNVEVMAIDRSIFNQIAGGGQSSNKLADSMRAKADARQTARLTKVFKMMEVSAQQRRNYPKGGVVFRQGDEADHFFIVNTGELEMSVTTPDGRAVRVKRLHPGDHFGYDALLADNHDTTVSCLTDVELTAVPQDQLRLASQAAGGEYLDETMKAQRSKRMAVKAAAMGAEQESQILPMMAKAAAAGGGVEYDKYEAMLAKMASRTYTQGESVFRQGEEARSVFLVTAGDLNVEAYQTHGEASDASSSGGGGSSDGGGADGGGMRVVARLGAGDHFGETALIEERKLRNTTVRCTSPVCELREMANETFLQCLKDSRQLRESVHAAALHRNNRRVRKIIEDSEKQGNASMIKLAPGEVLFRQGDRSSAFYVVEEGEVQMTLTPESLESSGHTIGRIERRDSATAYASNIPIPVRIYRAGECFGASGLLPGDSYRRDTATAMGAVTLKVIPHNHFKVMLRNDKFLEAGLRANDVLHSKQSQVEEGELGARGRHDEDICELDDEIVQKTMRK